MISKAIKFVKEQLTAEPSFVFVGPPASGKTVYFTCAMDRIKKILSQSPACGLSLQTEDKKTLKRHNSSISAMKKGGWPPKTMAAHKLYYLLTKKIRVGGKFHLADIDTRLIYHDYPGEVFEKAFGDENADPHWEKEAKNLKTDLQTAHGVFLVIDTPKLHNGEDEAYNLQLFDLLKFIENETKVKRICVIFTKRDLFRRDPEFDPKQHLRLLYDDAWSFLERSKAAFFFVTAVSNPGSDLDGNLVPPKGFETSQSENLIEPLAWALKLQL